jgi:hypothetical protein
MRRGKKKPKYFSDISVPINAALTPTNRYYAQYIEYIMSPYFYERMKYESKENLAAILGFIPQVQGDHKPVVDRLLAIVTEHMNYIEFTELPATTILNIVYTKDGTGVDPKFVDPELISKGIDFVYTEEFLDKVKREHVVWPEKIETNSQNMNNELVILHKDKLYEHIENLKEMYDSQNRPVLEEVYRQYSGCYLTTLIPLYIADTIVDKHRIPEGLKQIVGEFIAEKYTPELIEKIKVSAHPINMERYREEIGGDPDYYRYEDPQDYEIVEYDYAAHRDD